MGKVSEVQRYHQQLEVAPPTRALELAHDIYMMDPTYAKSIQLDESVWTKYFHLRFEELKKQGSSDILASEIQVALSFYQLLIVSLQAEFSIDDTLGFTILQGTMIDGSHVQADALSLIHKFLVFMGDLTRYQANLSSKSWLAPTYWYRTAYAAYPLSGKPFSSLAMLASFQSDLPNQLYYSSLAVCNINTNQTLKLNYETTLKNLLASPQPDAGTNEIEVSNSILRIVAEAYFYESAQLDSILEKVVYISQFLTAFTTEGAKMCVILIVAVEQLNLHFQTASSATQKQKIRNLQVLLFAILFDITSVCMEYACSKIQETNDSLAPALYPPSLICIWLKTNHNLTVYFKYGHFLQDYEVRLKKWTSHLVQLINLVSYFSDFDGIPEATAADFELAALSCFRTYFKTISFAKPSAEDLSVYISRISQYCRSLSEDENFAYIIFDNNQNKFLAIDKEAQKLKLIHIMATERLQNQVTELEKELGFTSCVDYCILDMDYYIRKLPIVKGLLRSQKRIVIVQIQLMQELDVLKKGEQKTSVQARSANSYLEQRFKYLSPFLIGQKSGQEIAPIQEDIFVPQAYESVLKCCLWAEKFAISKNGTFTLFTENQELKSLAESFGLKVSAI